MCLSETTIDALREETRFIEPTLNLIPSWVASNFEDRGGLFIGKVVHNDGWVSFTGIGRFTDDYIQEMNMVLFGRQLSAA